jgi:hypothetical protein
MNEAARSIYHLPMRTRVRDGYPIANCAEAWAKHRLHNRMALGLWLGWIPYGSLLMLVLVVWLHLSPGFMVAAGVPYLVALVIVGNRASVFRCPRCGSRFYAWGPFGLGRNGFARKCRNCGLRKWQCEGIG